MAFALVGAALLIGTVSAQQKDAVAQAIGTEAHTHAANMVGAAEAMPADKYSWKPSEPQVTFGYLINHAADANYTACSALTGEKKPVVAVPATGAKQALIDQMKQSFAFCDRAFDRIDPAKLDAAIPLRGRTVTGWWVLFHMALDWGDHYSQAAMMLRMNGIVPPSASRAALVK